MLKIFNILFLLLLLLMGACGTIRLDTTGCHANVQKHENISEIFRNSGHSTVVVRENFTTPFAIQEIKIAEMLNRHNINCEKVREMTVEIKTDLIIFKEVILTVEL